MLRLALSQVRDQPRRYVAVLLAIAVGVMFLAASLLVGSSTTATLRNTLAADFSAADLVVLADDPTALADAVPHVDAVDGVAEAYAHRTTAVGVQRPTGIEGQGTWSPTADFALLANLPDDPGLVPNALLAGDLPAGPGEVTIDDRTAEQYALAPGDTLTLLLPQPNGGEVPRDVTISGLVEASADPGQAMTVQLRGAEALVAEAAVGFADGAATGPDFLLLSLDPGASVTDVTTAVDDALATTPGASVLTPDDAAHERLEGATGLPLALALGAFAAIALLVTGLVIANTFTVLVAQRSRELALQRVVGATRRQVRGAVFAEAAVVGLIGSVAGLVAAIGLVAGGVAVIASQPGYRFAAFGMDWSTVAISLGVGLLLTLVASAAPALRATRVSPLEAMRPVPDASVGNRPGRVRLVIGGLLAMGGTALMVWAAFQQELALAIAGGAASFLGVLLLAALFVPGVVSGTGHVAAPTGVPSRMARLNAVRNPGRTAATAAALLIGTTLVALMLTGGRTLQQSGLEMLGNANPVDLEVVLETEAGPLGLTAAEEAAGAVAALDGVDAAAVLTPVGLTDNGTPVLAGSPAAVNAVLQEGSPALAEGQMLAPGWVEEQTLTVNGATGAVDLEVIRTGSSSFPPVIALADAAGLGEPEATAAPVLWVRADTGTALGDVTDRVEAVAEAAGVEGWQVSGALPERLMYQQIIDVMLLVVTGLLAVSVLIALIGVANTLSLSTIERTRENSLMRALGLTKKGLRTMLATEAVLIAGIAALLGSALGVFYGWMGAESLLGDMVAEGSATGRLVPTVPWLELAGVVSVAVVAGLLASVGPSRRAAKLSPVEGLAVL
ncbi:MAG: FtsX-like permease family protein [Actinomycetota bacterium]